MVRHGILAAAFTLLAGGQASAEFELSAYSGVQTARDGNVDGDAAGIGDFDFSPGWEGRSDEFPPYNGVRGTWWGSGGYGVGLEVTHAKVYGDEATIEDAGFSQLEFTDGLNLATANVLRRFEGDDRAWTPYVGGGVGVSVPYVEVETEESSTYEYQVTGPAFRWIAGVSYPVSQSWALFGEYQGTYSNNEADLDDSGSLDADIVTNSVNLGVSFNF